MIERIAKAFSTPQAQMTEVDRIITMPVWIVAFLLIYWGGALIVKRWIERADR